MNCTSGVGCSGVVPIRTRIQIAYRETVGSRGFHERRQRVPLTQQFIATCLAAEKRGEVITHPLRNQFPNILYESIIKMVSMICSRYARSCNTDLDDLVQECFMRITKRIGTFDPSKGMFSTWCWNVCSNTMNSRYHHDIRHTVKMVEVEDIENFGYCEKDTDLYKDIIATIREIAQKHPTKKGILFAMFDDPDSEQFCLPTKVKLSNVARETGVDYGKVMSFYQRVVQKTFKKRLARRVV